MWQRWHPNMAEEKPAAFRYGKGSPAPQQRVGTGEGQGDLSAEDALRPVAYNSLQERTPQGWRGSVQPSSPGRPECRSSSAMEGGKEHSTELASALHTH